MAPRAKAYAAGACLYFGTRANVIRNVKVLVMVSH
jgi:hypothetical protein